MIVKAGDNIDLLVTLADGADDRFVQAIIYQGNTQLNTIALNNLGDGLYFVTLQSLNAGFYNIRYRVFKDAGFNSIDRKYNIEVQSLTIENTIEQLREIIDEADGSAV